MKVHNTNFPYLKTKLFIQDLSTKDLNIKVIKIQDFNTNFPRLILYPQNISFNMASKEVNVGVVSNLGKRNGTQVE